MFFQNRVNDEKQNFGNSFDFLPKFVAISLHKIKYVKILLTFHNASIRILSGELPISAPEITNFLYSRNIIGTLAISV